MSTDSDPPLVKNTTASGMGARAAMRAASWTVGSVVNAPKEEYADRRRICAATASAISPRPKPTFAYHSPAVASR